MRRAVGAVLFGVGVFALVLAVLLPTVVVPASKKTPLNVNITLHSPGTASILDTATGTTKQVSVRATRIVRTDTSASNGTNTTVVESLCVVIVTTPDTPDCVSAADPRLLSATTDRVTANRKSAESVHVNGWGENVNGDTSVRHTGLSYKWPIDAKKQTYQFYEPDLKQAFPAKYVGTSKLKGLTVYEYVSQTGDQPYKIQGLVEGTYNDVRTVWIEPRTGVIVKGTERQIQRVGSATALDTTFTFDDKAVTDQANTAKSKISALRLAELWGPLLLIVIALAAFGGGFVLVRRSPTAAEESDYAGSAQT